MKLKKTSIIQLSNKTRIDFIPVDLLVL